MTREYATLAKIDLRSLATIERHAQMVLTQCGYLRRNGAGDEIRFGLIAGAAFDTWKTAVRADNRYARKAGWALLKWWIPKGWSA